MSVRFLKIKLKNREISLQIMEGVMKQYAFCHFEAIDLSDHSISEDDAREIQKEAGYDPQAHGFFNFLSPKRQRNAAVWSCSMEAK